MTKTDLMELAVTAHRERRYDEAASLYAAILQVNPEHTDALHYLGLILHNQGESEDGAALIEKSLSINPVQPDALNNLGNIYRILGEEDDAMRAYWSSVQFDPGHANAWANMAIIHRNRDEPRWAIKAVKIARLFDPNNFPARHTLGLCHVDMKEWEKAAEVFSSCIEDDLYVDTLPQLYANILNHFGREDEALAMLEQWVEKEPDNPIARYNRDAQKGIHATHAPTDYVRATFDSFADTFDGVLKGLNYAVPEQVAERAAQFVNGSPHDSVVDLGCGTGLVGPLVRPMAKHLVGVDLSPKMLARARKRECYDDLVEAELTEFLKDGPDARFDMALAADVLIYIGDIEPVLTATAAALKPGAPFIATFEATSEEQAGDHGFMLQTTGRHAHSEAYIERVARRSGLTIASMESRGLRMQFEDMVDGLLVTFVRPA